MRRLLHQAQVVATRPGAVLITGESGTGKSRLGEEIHAASPRRSGPFLRQGCGEFDLGTLEATLFGHTRDAYTSSQTDQQGLLGKADGGTLVLDDVDCLPLRAQAGLLRFMDDGGYYRLGEPGRLLKSDVRLILTTNHDLEALTISGQFRRDLWFRMRRWRLHVPPLRARREDIRELALHFLKEAQEAQGSYSFPCPTFDDEVLEFLQMQAWPGNIRDLHDAVKNIEAFGVARNGFYSLATVAHILFDHERNSGVELWESRATVSGPNNGTLDDAQVRRVLQMTGWNISLASRILGRSRTTLYKFIKDRGWRQP
ncbi:sigma-54-dependent Fis family transcriptional regulator (plasmid) [Azospirillum brasilense]|uniref:Sigma-54-dependent Fis family transcriptional regulator n=2 Tax=Azospirillum brasilense TaxID=192 RepID=A0A4D8R990_AZOBR|nr:sigma-54-dependent Fis family transcriptional regulator [Azospirillum brasilense]